MALYVGVTVGQGQGQNRNPDVKHSDQPVAMTDDDTSEKPQMQIQQPRPQIQQQQSKQTTTTIFHPHFKHKHLFENIVKITVEQFSDNTTLAPLPMLLLLLTLRKFIGPNDYRDAQNQLQTVLRTRFESINSKTRNTRSSSVSFPDLIQALLDEIKEVETKSVYVRKGLRQNIVLSIMIIWIRELAVILNNYTLPIELVGGYYKKLLDAMDFFFQTPLSQAYLFRHEFPAPAFSTAPIEDPTGMTQISQVARLYCILKCIMVYSTSIQTNLAITFRQGFLKLIFETLPSLSVNIKDEHKTTLQDLKEFKIDETTGMSDIPPEFKDMINADYTWKTMGLFLIQATTFLAGYIEFDTRPIQAYLDEDKKEWHRFSVDQYAMVDNSIGEILKEKYSKKNIDLLVRVLDDDNNNTLRWLIQYSFQFSDLQDRLMKSNIILSDYLFPHKQSTPTWSDYLGSVTQSKWFMEHAQNNDLFDFNKGKLRSHRNYTLSRTNKSIDAKLQGNDPKAKDDGKKIESASYQKRNLEQYIAFQNESQHPNQWRSVCVTAIQAHDIFPTVCMSFDLFDLYRREENVALSLTGETGSFHITTGSADEETEVFFTKTAVNMLEQTESFCHNKKYIAFRFGSPGHIAILLWDLTANVAEFFDPSSTTNTKDTYPWLTFFRTVRHPPRFKNVNAFNQFQSENEDDKYCQTYIYYYLYERVIHQQTPDAIMTYLKTIGAKNRIALMRQFAEFMLYDQRAKRKFITPSFNNSVLSSLF